MTNQEQTAEQQDALLDKLPDTPQATEAAARPNEVQSEAALEAEAEVPAEEAAPEAEVPAEEAAPGAEEPAPEAEVPAEEPAPEAEVPAEEPAPEAEVPVEAEAEAPLEQAVGADAAPLPVQGTAEAAEPAATPLVAPTLPPADGEPVASEGASYVPVEGDDTASKPRRLKDLEPDMELEGRVTSIALYGIFVDIGVGRDGLVHISEMSDTRIDSPSDLVQIGDTVKVRVKSIDPDARRISLTMRSKERPESQSRSRGGRKRPEVDGGRLSTLKVGDTVEGTVTGLAPFGAFVDIGVGKDGLVHISELSEGRVDKPEDAVQVGERYTFKLLEVDPEGTRISLSLRRAQRGQRMQQLEKGSILEGTVSGLATFGAFVDIGVGRDGLVHISELSEGRIGRVEEAVQVGQKVTVRVLEVDPNSKRISLTMRLEDRPEREERPERSTDRPERADRFERGAERSAGRAERPERGSPSRQPERVEVGVEDEPEEEPKADATLEDLVSKFGGSTSNRRDKRRRQDEDEEEEVGDRFSRRQRDAIRRTIQQMGDDE